MGLFQKKKEQGKGEQESKQVPTTIFMNPVFKVLQGFKDDVNIQEPIIRLTRFMREQFGLGKGDPVLLRRDNKLVKARVEISSASDREDRICRLNRAARQALAASVGDQIEIVPPETLILLIDTSGSMGDYVQGIVKMEATKNAVREFIRSKFLMAQDDRLGIISFGEAAIVVEKPSTNYEYLENLAMTLYPNGATAMYEGMNLAIEALPYPGGVKRIVLLTDGVATTTGRAAIIALAKRAAQLRIVIDTVGVGSPFDFMGYDEALLIKIAAITGGTFRRVIDIQELTGQFVKIAEGKNYTYLLPGK